MVYNVMLSAMFGRMNHKVAPAVKVGDDASDSLRASTTTSYIP